MENENKKLSLEDLKNEANRVEEEEQQEPTKEQVEQQLAAMKAFNNAQAFKQKKMAEFKATEEERKKKQEEEQTIADQEHFQKAVDGELYLGGAWNDRNKANEVAIEIGGEVVTNE